MASYSVLLKRSAAGELEAIPRRADRVRIIERIRGLMEDPRPIGSEKLAGRQSQIRIRQGDYQVLCEVDDQEHMAIVRIAHRKSAYR